MKRVCKSLTVFTTPVFRPHLLISSYHAIYPPIIVASSKRQTVILSLCKLISPTTGHPFLSVSRLELLDAVLNLCAYHHPKDIILPSGYVLVQTVYLHGEVDC